MIGSVLIPDGVDINNWCWVCI